MTSLAIDERLSLAGKCPASPALEGGACGELHSLTSA